MTPVEPTTTLPVVQDRRPARGEGTMKKTLIGALALAITSGVGVAAFADNDKTEDRIEARFHHDAKLKGHDLKVDVDDGVATLKGKVSTEAEKVRAERLAHIAGVTKVDNKIDVDSGAAKDRIEENAKMAKKRVDERADRAKDRIDDQEDRAKDRLDTNAKGAKQRADHAVDRTDQRGAVVEHPQAERKTNDTAGDEVTDAWITTKVKTQFIGVDALKGSDLSVDTNQNGVVTLTGTVPNEVARAKAIEIAKTTKGVHKVIDELKLAHK
jgi:osmotically-inducible protein OsmY